MVLVVDDHDDTRAVLLLLLKREGYQSVGKNCGTDALFFLSTNTPKLVILDYSMPDMCGLSVFNTMRADPRLATVPVIMFSANDGQIEESARHAGVDAYIRKGTLDWGILRTEIRRLAGPATPPAVSPITPPKGLRSA